MTLLETLQRIDVPGCIAWLTPDEEYALLKEDSGNGGSLHALSWESWGLTLDKTGLRIKTLGVSDGPWKYEEITAALRALP